MKGIILAGGCLTNNDKVLTDKVGDLGNYGSDYKHHHIYKGVNSRLDEIQVTFFSVKLSKKYLNDNGIVTIKHYPIPMHEQEFYKDLGIKHS